MFQDINFKGISRKYCNSSFVDEFVSYDAGQFENDQLSSVKTYFINSENQKNFSRKVYFWENTNKTGFSYFTTAPYNLSSSFQKEFSQIGNDKVSSFEISPRICLDIFQDVNFGGWKYSYCNYSTTESLFVPLVSGFQENDNLSSFKIRVI